MPFETIHLVALIHILTLGTLSFVIALLLTPLLTHFLFKYRLGKQIRSAALAPVFNALHEKKSGTPTMGGLIVWGTTILIAGAMFLASRIFGGVFTQLNFVDRAETYLPLASLLIAGIIGLIDDVFGIIYAHRGGQGLSARFKIWLYLGIAAIGAWWFYGRLDWDILRIPLLGNFSIGPWYIPLFMFVIIASAFSANETDGLDGLAGGVLLIAFVAFGIVSFVLGRYELATLIAVISGSLVAFLWFNIYPARFFMGDTGSMSLGVTLGVIAMLTNMTLLLPLFGFILVIESLSVIIQMGSKRFFGKKIFRSAPIHHHFESLGWPETKVTMRFWIIAGIAAGLGLILFFLDRFM